MNKIPDDIKKANLLFADDDYISEMMIKATMENIGNNRYRIANCGAETLQMYSESIDLTLIDMRMPDMDGWDVAKEILKMDPDARLLYLTSYHHLYIPEESKNKGVFAVIEKPISEKKIIDSIISYSKRFLKTDNGLYFHRF